MTKAEQARLMAWRLKVLRYSQGEPRQVARTCRHFGISRNVFYRWKRRSMHYPLTQSSHDGFGAALHGPELWYRAAVHISAMLSSTLDQLRCRHHMRHGTFFAEEVVQSYRSRMAAF